MAMSVTLHLEIGEVILEGVTVPPDFEQQLVAELRRLLLAPEALALLQSRDPHLALHLDGGQLAAIGTGNHTSLGTQLGSAIARSLLHPRESLSAAKESA